MLKIEYRSRKCANKMQKKSFLSEIIASEDVAINCLHWEENTCHRQPICQRTVLRLCVSLTQTFSDWFVLTVINKYSKGDVLELSTVFWPVYPYRSVLWNGTFQTFISPRFSDAVSSKIHQLQGPSFFWKCWKLNLDFQNPNKYVKNVFLFLR